MGGNLPGEERGGYLRAVGIAWLVKVPGTFEKW